MDKINELIEKIDALAAKFDRLEARLEPFLREKETARANEHRDQEARDFYANGGPNYADQALHLVGKVGF